MPRFPIERTVIQRYSASDRLQSLLFGVLQRCVFEFIPIGQISRVHWIDNCEQSCVVQIAFSSINERQAIHGFVSDMPDVLDTLN
jgi:hypothetical protein